MAWKYKHDNRPVAEGERSVLLENGVFYIRTGVLSTSLTDPDLLTITYRLREIYDDAVVVPVNTPPQGANNTMTVVLS